MREIFAFLKWKKTLLTTSLYLIRKSNVWLETVQPFFHIIALCIIVSMANYVGKNKMYQFFNYLLSKFIN